MIHIAIFASGTGSNARKIINYFAAHPQIQVTLILTNNPSALVTEVATQAGIPVSVFTREEFYQSGKVLETLQQHHIQWVILAGFLWLVPHNLIQQYANRIINIHPALLPKFGGKGMYGMRVHQAVVENKETHTGITIHLVNEKYDEGEVLFQATCAVEPGDTAEEVAHKVQILEHMHFAEVIEKVILKNVY
ncbi:phosphoribosylglycinamide formyltransferase [Rhodocytophaga rosea]|uniref:Phosphoribosylglycinamide formyltransferase n=1 Tax=Rhodocytophaga rosea TaxID=2704465 RepID=A0A6C0GKT1_9BACT|nr:phosphoribosylglycinamide formyltransferase [Rhodocytophaga rosea]QHT68615.1 phosphoribosylglycinamide formyltransferase [Rhodocytophaga rosea]